MYRYCYNVGRVGVYGMTYSPAQRRGQREAEASESLGDGDSGFEPKFTSRVDRLDWLSPCFGSRDVTWLLECAIKRLRDLAFQASVASDAYSILESQNRLYALYPERVCQPVVCEVASQAALQYKVDFVTDDADGNTLSMRDVYDFIYSHPDAPRAHVRVCSLMGREIFSGTLSFSVSERQCADEFTLDLDLPPLLLRDVILGCTVELSLGPNERGRQWVLRSEPCPSDTFKLSMSLEPPENGPLGTVGIADFSAAPRLDLETGWQVSRGWDVRLADRLGFVSAPLLSSGSSSPAVFRPAPGDEFRRISILRVHPPPDFSVLTLLSVRRLGTVTETAATSGLTMDRLVRLWEQYRKPALSDLRRVFPEPSVSALRRLTIPSSFSTLRDLADDVFLDFRVSTRQVPAFGPGEWTFHVLVAVYLAAVGSTAACKWIRENIGTRAVALRHSDGLFPGSITVRQQWSNEQPGAPARSLLEWAESVPLVFRS